MLSIRQRNELRRIIMEYSRARVNLSWKGANHPDQGEKIEKQFIRARKRLNNKLDELTLKGFPTT